MYGSKGHTSGTSVTYSRLYEFAASLEFLLYIYASFGRTLFNVSRNTINDWSSVFFEWLAAGTRVPGYHRKCWTHYGAPFDLLVDDSSVETRKGLRAGESKKDWTSSVSRPTSCSATTALETSSFVTRLYTELRKDIARLREIRVSELPDGCPTERGSAIGSVEGSEIVNTRPPVLLVQFSEWTYSDVV